MNQEPHPAPPALPPTTVAPEIAIDIRHLRVDYGDTLAVDDLCLQIPQGEIFGLVGPNGAGKTSTFKVLATLMEPTFGEVRLCGIDSLNDPAAVGSMGGIKN